MTLGRGLNIYSLDLILERLWGQERLALKEKNVIFQ